MTTKKKKQPKRLQRDHKIILITVIILFGIIMIFYYFVGKTADKKFANKTLNNSIVNITSDDIKVYNCTNIISVNDNYGNEYEYCPIDNFTEVKNENENETKK